MNNIVRNILAIIVGWGVGSAINMSLVQLGHSMFPIEGVNPEDMEALAEAMPNLTFEHFLFPFLAHALGTLVGAFLAGKIAGSHKMKFAMTIGFIFLLGGVLVSLMIPAPTWFLLLDLILAYIPMAWIGAKLSIGKK